MRPRDENDHDECGCAWKSDPVDRLCRHCRIMRIEHDAEVADRLRDEQEVEA